MGEYSNLRKLLIRCILSAKDYGALYCSGENIIGAQAEPCEFTIVPTGEWW